LSIGTVDTIYFPFHFLNCQEIC